MTATSYLGKPTSRIDGRAKVTGTAKYAAEYNVPGLAHGVVVSSRHRQGPHQAHSCRGCARGRGRARRVHARASAQACVGGREVCRRGRAMAPFRPLYDDRILFSGQPVALVVAEEFEIARLRPRWSANMSAGACHRLRRATRARRPGLEATHRARQGRGGVWPGGRAGRGRISHAGRTPQSDGDIRGDGGVGRRRPDHRLRQDAGPAKLPELHRQRVRDGARPSTRAVALRRRRIRIRAASAISVAARRAGGARAQALRAGNLTRQQMFTLGYRSANVQELALAAASDGSLLRSGTSSSG